MFNNFKSSQISQDQQRNLKGGVTGPYKASRDNAYTGENTGGDTEDSFGNTGGDTEG